MQMKIKIYCLVLLATIFSGCAAIYNPIEPAYLNYELAGNYQGLKLSYRYGILAELNNKRFAKKESKNKLQVIALKIENTTDRSFVFDKDFVFASENQPLVLMENQKVAQLLKQKTWPSLAFLLLALAPQVETTNGASVADFPVGQVAGPMLAIGNIIVKVNSNKQFQSELAYHSINAKEIKPKETAYAIITIAAESPMPIEVKFIF
jgi:hypothetical protein